MTPDPSAVGPWWLERQLDLTGPDVVVVDPTDSRTADLPRINHTHRSWTAMGTLTSPERAAVDQRGLVSPGDGSWSLDWWVGTGDRWRFPSREPAIRQRLLGSGPVLETLLRVPEGDVVQRVAAVESTVAGERGGSEPILVLEFENRSKYPVAFALAVMPHGPVGLGRVDSIEVDELGVSVDGRRAVLCPRPPSQIAVSSGTGDVASVVAGERATTAAQAQISCPDGRAQAALIFPLVHTAVLRVLIPLRQVAGDPVSAAERLPLTPPVVPELARVANGWDVQARRGMRVVLPAGRLADLVETGRRNLLGAVAGPDLTGWPQPPAALADMAAVAEALDGWGFCEEVDGLLGALEDHQDLDGTIIDGAGRADSTGAALVLFGRHWGLVGDAGMAEAAVPLVAKALHSFARRRRSPRPVGRSRGGPRGAQRGLLPPGPGPRWAGASLGPSVADAAWAIAGLRSVVEPMRVAGQVDVAVAAASLADELTAELVGAWVRGDTPRTSGLPAHLGCPIGPGSVSTLVAVEPLGLLRQHPEVAESVLDWVREASTAGPAVAECVGPAGLSPQLTLWLARAEIDAGDRRALERLAWVAGVASASGAWPEVVHPRTGEGALGNGHHTPTGAAMMSTIRELLITTSPLPGGESGAKAIDLCSLLPDGWEGQGIEVHDAPTCLGTCSYALRWHGDRPALLWEIDPLPGVDVDEVRWRAPGLDGSWEGVGRAGEALLAPYVLPPTTADVTSPQTDRSKAEMDAAGGGAGGDQSQTGSRGISVVAVDLPGGSFQ